MVETNDVITGAIKMVILMRTRRLGRTKSVVNREGGIQE